MIQYFTLEDKKSDNFFLYLNVSFPFECFIPIYFFIHIFTTFNELNQDNNKSFFLVQIK